MKQRQKTMAKATRRSVLAAIASAPFMHAAAAQAAWPHFHRAPTAPGAWPQRRVRVVVPYPPGGATDATARIIFAKVRENLGRAFFIENRAGASGTVGEAIVARSAHDGYTLLHDNTAFSVNGSIYPHLRFDYRKDFVPVFLVSQVPDILVVHPSVPVKTVDDVVAFAKSAPDGIDMASAGFGTLPHLCLEMLRHRAGIKIHHLPYRGGAPALNDLMSGHVKFSFGNAATAASLIKSGRIKGIAHTGKGRLAGLPDVPPISDTLPGFEALDWNGVFIRQGTPSEIVQKLNVSLNEALASAQVSARFTQLNIQSHRNTPEEFHAFVEEQMAHWSRVVKENDIRVS
jgi:tripartite-type tricarboxylate transporter receptor subunit TctC